MLRSYLLKEEIYTGPLSALREPISTGGETLKGLKDSLRTQERCPRNSNL